jgi:hypothetical protein
MNALPDMRRMARLAAFLSLFMLAACGDSGTPGADASTDAALAKTAAARAAQEDGADEKLQAAGEKLQAYVECYNQHDEQAHKLIGLYTGSVHDMEIGPTGEESFISLSSLKYDGIEKCQARFAEIVKQEPAFAGLDAAADAYITALAALGASVKEAYPYYDQKNYLDDKFAKGKAMHSALSRNMQAFAQASAVFSDALEAENNKLLAEQLALIEKTEGRSLRYLHMSLMAEARRLTEIMSEEDFPVDVAAGQLEKFEKLQEETLTWRSADVANVTGSPYELMRYYNALATYSNDINYRTGGR